MWIHRGAAMHWRVNTSVGTRGARPVEGFRARNRYLRKASSSRGPAFAAESARASHFWLDDSTSSHPRIAERAIGNSHSLTTPEASGRKRGDDALLRFRRGPQHNNALHLTMPAVRVLRNLALGCDVLPRWNATFAGLAGERKTVLRMPSPLSQDLWQKVARALRGRNARLTQQASEGLVLGA